MRDVELVRAEKDRKLVEDPSGFFIIMLDRKKKELVVEHYLNVRKEGSEKIVTGRLNRVVRGTDALSIVQTIVREGLVSRLEHSGYLGVELARAQRALETGGEYEQGGCT